jgi:hypothetical protein
MDQLLPFKETEFDGLIEYGFLYVVKLGDTIKDQEKTIVHLYPFKNENDAKNFLAMNGKPKGSFIMPVDDNLAWIAAGTGRLEVFITFPF